MYWFGFSGYAGKIMVTMYYNRRSKIGIFTSVINDSNGHGHDYF